MFLPGLFLQTPLICPYDELPRGKPSSHTLLNAQEKLCKHGDHSRTFHGEREHGQGQWKKGAQALLWSHPKDSSPFSEPYKSR